MAACKGLLVTGGSGFIGKMLLARLLDDPRYQRLYLLIRPKRGQAPEERIRRLLAEIVAPDRLEAELQRVLAVSGDLTTPGLGIPDDKLDELATHIDQVVHIGASTDFAASLPEARAINVEGTRAVLDLATRLAARGSLQRFDYVSTAFVSGKAKGVVCEHDLDRSQEFCNAYEQSKFEAELLVRSYAKLLPTTIYRPSIVVGDSRHGFTPHFKVLYWPLMVLARGLVPFFAYRPRARLDIVPVDYVVNAMHVLMASQESIGQTFHLTAGLGREVRMRRVLKDAYRFAGIKRRLAIPAWIIFAMKRSPLARFFDERIWQTVDMAKPYYAYLEGSSPRFDASRTQRLLAAHGLMPPSWQEYGRHVLAYCKDSRWGRRLPEASYHYYRQ
jgi:long-chain acyl-CoA synthetase